MKYSFIVPVYNRPDEIDELLESILRFETNASFEVLVIEDGSTITCEHIIDKYINKLNISYYFKPNSGPGMSRNYGMERAKGEYFIILDSDCILPCNYLESVDNYLSSNKVDFFGGPDKAHESFSDIQKAINIVMTSFLTTGGIRGGTENLGKFQPRSFNMGISKDAFLVTNGFGKIHPGEDPDLSIRLWEMGYKSALIKDAFVYHKRRINWEKFYKQVNKFGKARPILNYRFPNYTSLKYWFPSLFVIGYVFSLIMAIFDINFALILLIMYLLVLFIEALLKTKSLKIAFFSLIAVHIQFIGYGLGFFESFIKINILKKKPEEAMPEMFFK